MASTSSISALQVLMCLVITVICLAPLPSYCTDPDPLQDFCVADMNAPPPLNGFPCKPASKVVASDFISNALINPGNVNNVFKFNVTQGNVNSFPGVNTLGVAMNRLDFGPFGLNPPHSHPRSTEIGIVLEGKFLIGFIDGNKKLFSNIVHAGQIFTFPRGLIHFQRNLLETKGFIITAFNSQNAGVEVVPTSIFASNPPIPDFVVAQAFQIDDKLVSHIRVGLANA